MHSPTKDEKYNDVIKPSVQQRTLEALSRLIADPPVRPSPIEFQIHRRELINTWQNWIAEHKNELSKLEPTGEGVDFSDKACKNGKPRKKR